MLPEFGSYSFKRELSEQATRRRHLEIFFTPGSDVKQATLAIAQAGPKPIIARCVAFENIDQETAQEAIFSDLKPRTNPRIFPVPGEQIRLEQVVTLLPTFISRFFPKVKDKEIRIYCLSDNNRRIKVATIPESRDRLLQVA